MKDFRFRIYEKYRSLAGKNTVEEEDVGCRKWRAAKFLPLLIKVPRDSSILEVGCGSGAMLELLRKEGFHKLQGIDISEEQAVIGQKKGLHIACGDAIEFLRERVSNFDVVLAIDFLEHFTKEELMELIPLVHHALKSDGLLIAQTPNASGLFPRQVMYDDLTHVSYFTPSSVQQLLSLHGFVDFSFFETGPLAIGLKSFLRKLLWSSIRLVANAVRIIETGKVQEIWTENFIVVCRR